MEVLIAISNVVGQHPANQAILFSLAKPLTDALAYLLSTLPKKTSTTLTYMAGSSTQTDSAEDQQQTSTGLAAQTAADASAEGRETPRVSALTQQIRGRKIPSALTAQLKGMA